MVSLSFTISLTLNPSPMSKLGSPKSTDTLPKVSTNSSSGINAIWRQRGRFPTLKPKNSLIVSVSLSSRHPPKTLQMSNKLSSPWQVKSKEESVILNYRKIQLVLIKSLYQLLEKKLNNHVVSAVKKPQILIKLKLILLY